MLSFYSLRRFGGDAGGVTIENNIMRNQYKINVRSGIHSFNPGETLETIKRTVYCDQVGNFNRLACRYRGKTFLVHSEAGDIGDPFRADESYANSLFIMAEKPCAWNL